MRDNCLTVAICTYNRVERLPGLVAGLREQDCPVPFDILFVDNNSTDGTPRVIDQLAGSSGAPVRSVRESQQGITFARNRALHECPDSKFILFIDDDEIPCRGLLASAVHALDKENAECVGGRVLVALRSEERPSWLDEELVAFLGNIDYGTNPFWVSDESTPIFSGNIAYRMEIFDKDTSLRFDNRYNRQGKGIGGGEDFIIFRQMLSKGLRIRYRSDMVVEHYVEPWRLKRSYFLKLHFRAGLRQGRYQMPDFPRQVMGVPPFLLLQVNKHCLRAAKMWLKREPRALRQTMNAAYAVGQVIGKIKRSLQ